MQKITLKEIENNFYSYKCLAATGRAKKLILKNKIVDKRLICEIQIEQYEKITHIFTSNELEKAIEVYNNLENS